MDVSEWDIITIAKYYENADKGLYEELIQFRLTHKIKIINYNDKILEYLITGSGNKTLLFFHGALGSADTPYREILRLKHEYRIITPTIRNYKTLDEVSDGVNEILKRENINRIIVRGGSFGAFIAQAFFRRNFHKIDGLILINAISPKGEYSKTDQFYVKFFNILMRILPGFILKKLLMKDLKKLANISTELTKEQQIEVEFLLAQMKERMAKVKKRHIREALGLVVELDLKEKYAIEDLNGWKGKVLIITDKEDSSYKTLDLLLSHYPNPEVHVFEKAGHLLQIVFKEEFNRIFGKFIESI